MGRPNKKSRQNLDLISTLPDNMLHHILGFLEAKEAVQTCVLSKRWENLWTSLPSLNFNSSQLLVLRKQTRVERFFGWPFPYYKTEGEEDELENDDENMDLVNEEGSEDEEESENEEEIEDYEESEKEEDGEESKEDEREKENPGVKREHDSSFVKFVNTLLLRHKPLNLDVFQLSCDAFIEENTTTWIHYAVKHNTRVLHLSLCTGLLPSCIYTCVSLEELYLYDCGVIRLDTANLPNLRKLNIHTSYLAKNQLRKLLSACPLLESLWIEHCKFNEFEIAHEKLQHLTITDCIWIDVRDASAYKPTIKMPSLIYACVDFGKHPCIKRWTAFLGRLENAEILQLKFPWLCLQEGPIYDMPELSKFQQLQDLSIGFICMYSGFHSLESILESVPNLKKLTILQDAECKTCSDKKLPIARIRAASLRDAIYQCKSLEVVEIKYWRTDEMAKRLVFCLVDCTGQLNVKIRLSMESSARPSSPTTGEDLLYMPLLGSH